ncbi:MAG: RsmD family RNA methyltransferase, partial [Firmicutes bacterium]|nr:RsmD family RNA methyltransferase [Bacillota bacterium]
AVKKLATEGQSFDIILADPPYNSMYEQKLLDAIAEYDILKEDGILVIEHDSGIMLGNNKFDMDLRKCGNTSLSFFQKR